MSNELSSDNESYLHHVVARGLYRDRAEAIDQAVSLLKRRDELRSDVLAGIEQADRGELLDGEQVFERLRERAEQIELAARAKQ
jgi:predicted transcriptional regulator